MTEPERAKAARADWANRLGPRGAAARDAVPGSGVTARQDGRPPGVPGTRSAGSGTFAPPTDLRATPGRGHVTLNWAPVPGAAGYLVHRAARPRGPFRPIDHGGGDVLAVPAGPYADTALGGRAPAYYAVAAISSTAAAGPLSEPVAAAPDERATGRVTVTVGRAAVRELPRPWEPMIGSEHLSHLLRADTIGGQVIGRELRDALRVARETFGIRAVRAHGILGDELGVYAEDAAGRPVHDFSGVYRVYDELLEAGLRPVVELSFMPRDLARDPGRTVFSYGAVISPPKDWGRWANLVSDLVRHLIGRYGRSEVLDHWSFEVWNEPNLDVFWSGTPEEYFRLYDVTARAIRSVDPALRVGGPASAASGWIDEFLAHLDSSGAPLDFLSTHTYGNSPLDLRPALDRHGRGQLPIWWTEWGTTPTHFNRVGDTVFAATFLLRGMRSALGRVGALSHWVASDHFEELGAPEELFHGGFGLLSVGNLRKPRFWALALLARLGATELAVDISGDGAWGLVEALAARGDDGRIGVLVWNSTLDQGKMHGDQLLERQIRLQVSAAPKSAYTVTHHRIDAAHSNIVAAWERLRGTAPWPDQSQWQLLHKANTLDELTQPASRAAGAADLMLDFTLPMPGISYVELIPADSGFS
jgi:xylan 1,4-beta-xylosidase